GSLPSLRALLASTDAGVVRVEGMPNARVEREVFACNLLSDPSGPQTAGELREVLEQHQPGGVDPEQLWELMSELPYEADIGATGADGLFTAAFRRRDGQAASVIFDLESTRTTDDPSDTWPADVSPATYTNKSLPPGERLLPSLRQHLQERLPDYMIPAAL